MAGGGACGCRRLHADAVWGAEPLRILIGTTFSGAYAETGDYVRESAQLAVEMFGGQVLGRPIKIVERDVPNPSEGVKKAQEAVEKLGVKFFFVSLPARRILAVSEYAAKQQVLLIGAAGADKKSPAKAATASHSDGRSCVGRHSGRWFPMYNRCLQGKTFYAITPKYIFGEDITSKHSGRS
ncbi:MAG: ABC transporter substrate-binding protein [Desulfomicrobium escambiense]|nr:ABC transporter substrate-binding protein [Desulfomicrobium escambiense]